MQKKSLLVALFCGALCLVGCIKNEESASVAQVRIAKANELNSIADLNKAKAQAELIYANAEATIAQAEAKLREANAALVLAQAETEKVRAELLKVQVELAEVTVDEERVKLQLLEADLEKHLAEVEAAVAKAEAEKQVWVNALENLLAQAEIDKAHNTKRLIEAEDALEKYLLTQEGVKADSAKAYYERYFAAQEEIQKLQFQQIKTKATKALVEAGALKVRDAIYGAIDDIDDQIAENEAIIAILKERQYMDSTEAKAAVAEAKLALEDAYTAKAFADSIKKYAGEKHTTLVGKTADYTQDWKSKFKDPFKVFVIDGDNMYNRVRSTANPLVALPANQNAQAYVPVAAPQFLSDVYYGGHKVIDGVQYYGVYAYDEDRDFDNNEFTPLWTTLGSSSKGYRKWAAVDTTTLRYPDLQVYEGEDKDFIVLKSTAITPAKIDFENVNAVLDDLVAEAKADAAAIVKEEKEVNVPKKIKGWQDQIDAYEDDLDLHTKYVNERKAAVEAAEKAYIKAFKASKQREQDIVDAWEDFQEHMLVKHDVDRMLFVNQRDSSEAYETAKTEKTTAETNLNAAKAALTESEGALKTALENEAQAQGKYYSAIAGGIPAQTESDWVNAQKVWNPKFKADETAKIVNATEVPHTWANFDSNGHKIEGTDAKPVQNNLMNAQDSLKIWKQEEYEAQMVLWRTASTGNEHTTAQHNYDVAKGKRETYQAKVTSCQTDAANTESMYNQAKTNYYAAAAVAEKENWSPEFTSYLTEGYPKNAEIVFESRIDTTGHIKKNTAGKWVKGEAVAGSAQGALIDAVIDYREKFARVNSDTYGKPEQKTEKKILAEKTAAEAKAKKEYENATKRLIAAFKHVENWESIDLSTETISKYLDEAGLALWDKYDTAKKAKEVDLDKAWNTVDSLYWYNPNHIAATADPDYPTTWTTSAGLWPDAKNAQFSWWRSSYYVDPEAKMLDKATAQYYFIQFALNGNEQATDENGDKVWEEIDDYKIPVPTYYLRNCYSLAYQVEVYQSYIDAKDDYLEWFEGLIAERQQEIINDIEAVRAAVAPYKSLEASYLSWIKDIETSENALNEFKKTAFDAEKKYKAAKNYYEAVKYIANGFVYVYDPDNKFSGEHTDGFVKLDINTSIQKLEGDAKSLKTIVTGLETAIKTLVVDDKTNTQLVDIDIADMTTAANEIAKIDGLKNMSSIAELSFAKEVLESALKYGKVALQYVINAYDEEIAQLDEKIDFWTVLANKYKAIMNYYLGIVDEAVVEEPVAEEGDEE